MSAERQTQLRAINAVRPVLEETCARPGPAPRQARQSQRAGGAPGIPHHELVRAVLRVGDEGRIVRVDLGTALAPQTVDSLSRAIVKIQAPTDAAGIEKAGAARDVIYDLLDDVLSLSVASAEPRTYALTRGGNVRQRPNRRDRSSATAKQAGKPRSGSASVVAWPSGH